MILEISSIPAGSTLTVDRETLEVKLDGEPAYNLVNGVFPYISKGDNSIEYSDGESSRDIDLEVTYTERYQ